MNRKKEIQPWRYAGISLAFFCLLLPKLRLFSGADGALGIVLATVILCVLHRVCQRICRRQTRSAEGIPGKILAVVRILWYVAVLVVLTGLSACLMRDCFWPGMSRRIAWVLLLLMLLPALGRPHGVWQRVIAVTFGWMLLFVAGMPILAARQMQTTYLPLTLAADPAKILAAAFLYLVFSWYLLLIPATKNRGMWPDSKEGLYLLNGIFLAGLCLVIGQVYGPEGASFRRWPVLSLLQGISVPGKFLERVDAFWAAVCLLALFLAAGLLLERIFASLSVLGIGTGTVRMWRYKDLAALFLLAVVVLFYRYSGVEAQDRVYVSTFIADKEGDAYVFWFPQQEKEETVYAVHGASFQDALERFTENSRKQPDFGHIRATIVGERLLEDAELTNRLFTELAAWQDMDENSYVFQCSDPRALLSADTEDTVCGIYLSELYENHFGVKRSPLVLRELMVDWENGERHRSIPRIIVKDNGCFVEWIT